MTVPGIWYYADRNERIGPLTLEELKGTLQTLANPADVLVWCEKFSDWRRAGDVSELRVQVIVPPPLPPRPPPLPREQTAPEANDYNGTAPTWDVKWWWVIVAFVFLGSVGSRVGREEMERVAAWRRMIRKARRSK